MSKDKIEVNMNVYDIPIVVEVLEEANKEIERLNNIIKEVRELLSQNWYAVLRKRTIRQALEILDKEEL